MGALFASIPTWAIGLVGAGAVGTLLNLLLKRFVTEARLNRWGGNSQDFGFAIGRIVTLGLSSWGPTSRIWNSTLEPIFLVLVEKMAGRFLIGFGKGAQSDNASVKVD